MEHIPNASAEDAPATPSPPPDIYDEVAYAYDGSLEGLLSAVFAAYERHEHPTDIALQELYGKEVKYCCNRKEVKDHGADAGNLLGAELHDGDKVIMVEDVTTSGKSIDETYPILKAAADVDVRGLIVSLNRMEVGKGGVTTAQKEIEAKYGFPVASIVSMAEVKECLHNHEVAGRIVIDDDIAAAIDAYYEQWGAKE